jgi:hypothetical protein
MERLLLPVCFTFAMLAARLFAVFVMPRMSMPFFALACMLQNDFRLRNVLMWTSRVSDASQALADCCVVFVQLFHSFCRTVLERLQPPGHVAEHV